MRKPLITLMAGLMLAPLVGRSQLMTPSDQTQITSWLGDGPLVFTDAFTSDTANPKTSVQFHLAADGIGPTITLASIKTYSGQTMTIGGFDPQSWDSYGGNTGNGFNTFVAGEPNAFIFNLTTDTIQYENSNASGYYYQTEDSSDIGPTWGIGTDLAFGAYLGYGSELLNRGAAFSYSYGGTFGTDILGNPASFDYLNGGIFDSFTVNELDVYTFAPPSKPTASPDGGTTALLLGLSGAVIALLKTRRTRRQTA